MDASAWFTLSNDESVDVLGTRLAQPAEVFARADTTTLSPNQVLADATSLTLSPLLNDGRNQIVVTARDETGAVLYGEATIWSGPNTLQVHVVDAGGTPVSGATVIVSLGDDPTVTAVATTSGGNAAAFAHLPTRTLAVRANMGTQAAGTAIFGDASSITLVLTDIGTPSTVDNNDFLLGLDGWDVGTAPVAIVSHIEERLGTPLGTPSSARASTRRPREEVAAELAASSAASGVAALAATDNFDLQVSTAGEGLQTVARTFSLPEGARNVKVRYRFITTEVPGGYFGTEFNDYFLISVRSSTGGALVDGNSMNALGLGAFDSVGATDWLGGTLDVNAAGAQTVQVNIGVANVADGLLDSQLVVDAITVDGIEITSDKATACPNETVTFTANTSTEGTIAWSGTDNPASGTGMTFTGRFATPGSRRVTATLTAAAGGSSSGEKTLTINELSGTAWVSRFPGSTSLADLDPSFRTSAENFIDALGTAGASVTISATLRPKERAYLMHYAYKVAHDLDPATVPAQSGVDICWTHRNTDGAANAAASKAAASAMVNAYNIAYAPALVSRHTEGRAVDMTISWPGDLTIRKADGTDATITSQPRSGNNTDLHAIGAGYGAAKLVSDPPHWSSDGH